MNQSSSRQVISYQLPVDVYKRQVEKTPEWAAPICGISADRIKELAAEIGAAKPLYVVQGWGPQRRSNGELNCWSIMVLPLLTGQVGLPGTSNGCREGSYSISLQSLPEMCIRDRSRP